MLWNQSKSKILFIENFRFFLQGNSQLYKWVLNHTYNITVIILCKKKTNIFLIVLLCALRATLHTFWPKSLMIVSCLLKDNFTWQENYIFKISLKKNILSHFHSSRHFFMLCSSLYFSHFLNVKAPDCSKCALKIFPQIVQP